MVELKSFFLKSITIVLCLTSQKLANSLLVKFTKFECLAFDKPFADIPKCQLKALARNKIALNLHVRLHQIPVNNVSVNAAFLVKDFTQRFQPFLYNSSLDFCKFLKNSNRLPFWKIIYDIIKPASNINHTCPYSHDIIVSNLILDGTMLKMLPLPSGEYLVLLRVLAYNNLKAEIRTYIFLQE